LRADYTHKKLDRRQLFIQWLQFNWTGWVKTMGNRQFEPVSALLFDKKRTNRKQKNVTMCIQLMSTCLRQQRCQYWIEETRMDYCSGQTFTSLPFAKFEYWLKFWRLWWGSSLKIWKILADYPWYKVQQPQRSSHSILEQFTTKIILSKSVLSANVILFSLTSNYAILCYASIQTIQYLESKKQTEAAIFFLIFNNRV
jgi:hypothetical protein